MAAARTVWFSLHLGWHRSAVSLSALHVSIVTQTIAPMWGCSPASVPPPAEGRSSPTNTPLSPPSSFILPRFAWVSVLFFTGQVLLPAPSWGSECTYVSEGLFLMYRWREIYSMSNLLLHHLVLSWMTLLKYIQICIFSLSWLWTSCKWEWYSLLWKYFWLVYFPIFFMHNKA